MTSDPVISLHLSSRAVYEIAKAESDWYTMLNFARGKKEYCYLLLIVFTEISTKRVGAGVAQCQT